MKWYQLKTTQVLQKLVSQTDGLNKTQRQERLMENGENKIAEKQQVKPWRKFLKHFTDLLMLVLLFAAILKFMTGDLVEGGIILLVVVVNGLVSYWQERKAEESLDGLKQMMSQEAVILTNGQKETVPTTSIVPGDILYLKAGDVVAADVRLVEVHDLVVEEAILTGEAEAVEKNTTEILQEAMAGDQKNMAFSGTLVQAGSATGVVVATGSDTEIGKINQALQTVTETTTPLVRKMHQLNKQIFRGILVLILFLVFFTTFRYGMELNLLFSAMIALIVAMIPEGLPAVLTMILSLGVKEMATENAIIKSMPSVETLGSMTVICSDKTGTLTKNEMTVVNTATENKALLMEIMNNCQDLKLQDNEDVTTLKGNPTELALLHYVAEEKLPLKKQIGKIPFSSSTKYMATMHKEATGNSIFIKGAPEVLLAKAKLSATEMQSWQQRVSSFAKKGQRVLAFAVKNVASDTALSPEVLTDLEFIGLVGIIDPPKESAIQAIKETQAAGIAVKMITGDHKDTAQAIGSEIGLKHTAQVLEGIEIDQLSDDELAQAVKKVDIFARTTPAHKLRIVTALQNNGEVVGMTGDGVNDAPALKKADIGIAMGIKGSEVTKQAADMVLADDNFHTIAKAVKEGRRIFDNLKKTINFFLPSALAQGLIVVIALLLNRPLPLTPVQILWVNMVTTITLSYALGFEKASKDTMTRPPRPVNEGILSGYSLFRIVYVSLITVLPAYFIALQFEGTALQQTILLQTIVMAQAVYMLNCRELLKPALNKGMLQNKALFISLGLLLLLQTIVVFTPIAQNLIGTTTLNMMQQLLVLGHVAILFAIVEAEKWVTRRFSKRVSAQKVN
jgi:calcium-translocating P-type ATPase